MQRQIWWPKLVFVVTLLGLSSWAAEWSAGAARQAEVDSGDASDASDKPLPLEAANEGLRDFELRTSQVTWLSVDVAPDGQTLVIDVLGDLFLLDAGGGAARSLTSGMAFDSQPSFSPDGTHVAFVSDRDGADNVWILPLDP